MIRLISKVASVTAIGIASAGAVAGCSSGDGATGASPSDLSPQSGPAAVDPSAMGNPAKVLPSTPIGDPSIRCDAEGTFCGGHGVTGGATATLYICPSAGAQPVWSSPCLNGCAANVSAGPAAAGAATPDACTVAAPTTSNAAVCPGKGLYCGADKVQGGDPTLLYDCPGAGLAPSSTQACASGCTVEPEGTNDFCKAAGVTCPGGGDYCGADGIVGGDVSTLYHCPAAGQAPSSSSPCALGCDVKPAGTNDVCKGTLSCPGKGDYCGSDGVQGGDASTLYHCPAAGQAPTSSDKCSGGCQVFPAGTPDVCGVTQNCKSSGDYCGNDTLGGASNVLFHCNASGQPPASSTFCGGGCSVQPQGTPDYCAGSSQGGGCNAQGNAARNWEANQLNSGHSWSDYCLAFVNNAYVNAGNSPWWMHAGDANTSLNQARSTGHFVDWNGSCPCGAVLYWAANSCNGQWGHITICNGDGTISTSGWPGYGGGTHASISWMNSQECGHAPAGYIVP